MEKNHLITGAGSRPNL